MSSCITVAWMRRKPATSRCCAARSLLVRAEAAFAMGDLRSANDLFRDAVAADDRAPLPRLRWGRMFLAAGQYGDAVKLFQEAHGARQERQGRTPGDWRASAVERFDGDIQEELDSLLKDDAQPDRDRTSSPRGWPSSVAATRMRSREAQRRSSWPCSRSSRRWRRMALLAAVEVMRERDPAALHQARRWTTTRAMATCSCSWAIST